MIHESCRDILWEFNLYRWNEKSSGDFPIKENDHAMDDMRYFVSAVLTENRDDDFIAMSVLR